MSKIKQILDDIYTKYPVCKGEIKQTIFREMAKNVMSHCDGDILEIGAHEGKSTMAFSDVAKNNNRTVHVVDPWDGGQEGNEKVYQTFLKNTSGSKNINVIRKSSLDKEAISYIRGLDLSFCLIDGLHTKRAVTSDILSVQGASFKRGIVIVDDVRDLYGCLGLDKCQDIMDAVNECQSVSWRHIESPPEWLCSCYIVE